MNEHFDTDVMLLAYYFGESVSPVLIKYEGDEGIIDGNLETVDYLLSIALPRAYELLMEAVSHPGVFFYDVPLMFAEMLDAHLGDHGKVPAPGEIKEYVDSAVQQYHDRWVERVA